MLAQAGCVRIVANESDRQIVSAAFLASVKLSLVIPVFNEAPLLERLHREVTAVVHSVPGTTEAAEIIYVDDGSSDNSLALLLDAQKKDNRVIVLQLSRNWGHQSALTAGLAIATGNAVILMDADLQDPPAVIPDLVRAWQNGAKVVVAQRRRRAETGLRKWLFPMFYRLLGFLSDFPIPLNSGIFGLIDRAAVDAINALSETNRYLPGLRAWVGFPTEVVFYERASRASGESKQSVWKLLRYALDAIFSFSYKPLRIGLFAGVTAAALAVVYGIALVTCRLLGIGFFGQPVVTGYTSTIVSLLFLGGIQLISVGILGEYIGRIYDEVKRRPLFIVQREYRKENSD